MSKTRQSGLRCGQLTGTGSFAKGAAETRVETDASIADEDAALLTALLGVSEVAAGSGTSRSASAPTWELRDTVSCGHGSRLVLAPARLSQCPRCWRYQAAAALQLCRRCQLTVGSAAHVKQVSDA